MHRLRRVRHSLPRIVALSGLLVATISAAVPSASWAQSCDAGNPNGPARDGRIVLSSADLVEEGGTEMRSFVETGSLGKVDGTVISSAPDGIVRSFAATAATSSYSSIYGERLRGIQVTVTLVRPVKAPRVTLALRQVCAKAFRNSFLY